MSRNPHILMCPPTYFGVEYEINPWMDRGREVDHQRAVAQWTGLRDLLSKLGARITFLEPRPGLPDLVFTANAGLVFGNDVYLSRFRHPQRQLETSVTQEWFLDHGFQVTELPSGFFFEGAGDALFCGETLVAGYRIRSEARAHQWVAKSVSRRVIPLELVDPSFYHLDTCFCPLAPGAAIYFAAAFDPYARRAIADFVEDLIEVESDEAHAFACNAVVIGRWVVTNVGCPRLHEDLRRRGYEPIETAVDEFIKAGGGAKCLTLRLDGEDAAGWRTSNTEAREREPGMDDE